MKELFLKPIIIILYGMVMMSHIYSAFWLAQGTYWENSIKYWYFQAPTSLLSIGLLAILIIWFLENTMDSLSEIQKHEQYWNKYHSDYELGHSDFMNGKPKASDQSIGYGNGFAVAKRTTNSSKN